MLAFVEYEDLQLKWPSAVPSDEWPCVADHEGDELGDDVVARWEAQDDKRGHSSAITQS